MIDECFGKEFSRMIVKLLGEEHHSYKNGYSRKNGQPVGSRKLLK